MDWRQRVRHAAATAWPADRPPIAVAVRLQITHYGERPGVDIDNLIKPIQDALQGVAYHDDRQVKDVTGTWRDINGRYPVRYISPAWQQRLAMGVSSCTCGFGWPAKRRSWADASDDS